ncbi:MAG: SDR family NAD(P)-dependent oxidoreductase [Pseudomonadota bacterium]
MKRRQFLQSAALIGATGALASCAGSDKIPTPGVPRSDFDEDSTAEEVTEGVNLSGRLALVTGCTTGIGFETMRVLAKRGAWVIGTSRSKDRAAEACKQVVGTTTPLALELSDYDSIIRCADAVRSINQPLDILVCNAGFLSGDGELQKIGGIEKHFAINHLGHFVLVNRLLGRMYMANQGRIVVVSSRTAYNDAPEAGIEFDNLSGDRDYEDRRAYGHSKLANALFALQLGTLLKGTRITANALHPGVINTEIDRNMSGFMQGAFAVVSTLGYGKSVEAGAATSCYVATHPSLGATSGKFFEDCNAVTVRGVGHIHNAAMADRLWAVSTEMTREHLVEHRGADYNDYEKSLMETQRK